MLLAFELSGEHSTIPASELIACLESMGANFRIYLSLPGCMIIDLENNKNNAHNELKANNLIGLLTKRLSMTHHIIKVIGIGGQNEHEIIETVKSVNLEFEGTYNIRVKRYMDFSQIDTEAMERRIGGIFFYKGFRADLNNPDIRFRMLITGDKCIFGTLVSSVDRGVFETRKPHYKPFFYPGVLMPRVALALVNMAKPKECLLDPFCGTGGILTEAGLIGIKVIGGDMQRKILLGAKMNLDHYNANYSLMFEDACNLALKDESVDAVVTDPPYGRSAAIKADSLDRMLTDSLIEIHRVLKKGKRAVFVSEKPIENMAKEAGFRCIELHLQRVHKSLTRRIAVLEKPN